MYCKQLISVHTKQADETRKFPRNQKRFCARGFCTVAVTGTTDCRKSINECISDARGVGTHGLLIARIGHWVARFLTAHVCPSVRYGWPEICRPHLGACSGFRQLKAIRLRLLA